MSDSIMRAKLWGSLFIVALFIFAAIPLHVESQQASAPRQIPASSSTVLPQQPAALAGSQEPIIPPTISTIWPKGMRRGTTQTFTIDGRNLAGIKGILFDAPGYRARAVSVVDVPEKAQKIRINVDLGAEVPRAKKQKAKIQVTASPSAPPGMHSFRIQTPLGTSNVMAFDVGTLPEIETKAPGHAVSPDQPVALPATIVGAISAPGDVNAYRFTGHAGEQVVFRVVASQLGSSLRSVLILRDSIGKQLAQVGKFSSEPDAVLTYKLPANGQYTIAIGDQEEKAGQDHFYRLYAGALPYITSVFPLGVRVGHPAEVHVEGVNLGGIHEVRVVPPRQADGWTTVPLSVKTARGEVSNTVNLNVTDEPEIAENESNDEPTEAQPITLPVVINGRIDAHGKSGASSQGGQGYFRFTARKGERMTIAVAASRLGSPLDSVIEVLDSQGRPVPRALVRCLNETSLTLADRDSRTQGYRLVSRTGFHDNDYLMVGDELNQIQLIPDQPDADIILKGFGGQRIALLGTSTEAHYVTEPAYRAEILPPDAKFPPNGLPVFRLTYRNDDGGPGFGSDSRLDFVAPNGGQYLIHIKDVRGLQGPDFAYQLIVRDASPDFSLTASPGNPNIPRGGRVPVEIAADRMLGYQGPIEIRFLGLPKGITASATTIPAGQESATVILEAAANAPRWLPAAHFKIEGRGWVGRHEIVRVADPEAPLRVAALMPAPDLLVAAQPQQILLRPGETTAVTIHVTRENGFKGRVPCQVENLPPGVRVVNVGLNGILVHSGESSHTFKLKAESWALPATQPIYVVGAVESNASTNHASPAILLKVEGAHEMASAAAR
ncbi:MAG: hypothetical protein ACRD18_08855 [Terriglobia bacterium]